MEVRVDWEEGDLLSPPLNTWHEHVNLDKSAPARYYSVESIILDRLFNNRMFVEENDFIFKDRFSG